MKKLLIKLTEDYKKYRKEFEDRHDKAMTIDEVMSAYAAYTGKLEGLLDVLTIEVM